MNPNINFPFPKGSEWAKWDLQIHTPYTKLADNYTAIDPNDVWENFIKVIKNSDVRVFGVTDYFSIYNYEQLLEKIKTLDPNLLKEKTFFPNIELRLNVNANIHSEEANIHLIFSDQCDLIQIKTFLSKLKTISTKADGTHYYCTDPDLSQLGYATASVALSDIQKTLEETFGNSKPYLVIAAASGHGSIRADSGSSRKMNISDEIDKFADGFFGAATSKDYFLKDDRYEDQTVKSKSKPIYATSDCHSFEDCENFLGKQFLRESVLEKDVTWIKAEPTFEGLRQTTFEPKDRVCIQLDRPDNKRPYFIIDTVRFIDNTGASLFPSDYIQINQNLTTIVGGKSTGKSLLLHYIGKTVDEFEVAKRLGEVNAQLGYDFDTDPNFNFEVKWKDGYSSWLKTPGTPDEIGERKILYIPQNFLNKLSEKNIRSKDTLNGFVQNILLQDQAIKDKNQELQDQIKNLSKSIPVDITEVFTLKKEIAQVEEEAKQIGDEKGIGAFIISLEKEIDSIKKESGLKTEEITQYESLVEKEKEITTKISNLEEDKKTVGSFEESMNSEILSMGSTYKEYTNYLNDREIKRKFADESGFITSLNESLQKLVVSTIKEINKKIIDHKKELETVKKDLEPLLSRVKLQTELSKKNDTLKTEQQKLDKLASKKKTFGLKTELLKTKTNELKSAYSEIYSKYDSLKNEFKKYENRFDDITISVNVGFRNEDFNTDVINEFINKISLKKVLKQGSGEEYEYQYDPQTHIDIMNGIVGGLISDEIKTIKGRSSRDAIQKLLENRFYLDFRIGYQGDPLDKMSPGKKSLVLLKLLVDLSDEEWPILLDQPEDDLDNRSVYKDLVLFLKEKKKQRQIIIVTHNPNLTVGSDAEEVIVANQSGQEIGRDNKKFKFEYVSGGLENSFELDEIVEPAILYRKGIRQHVCEVLEGGKEAFQKREQKYDFK